MDNTKPIEIIVDEDDKIVEEESFSIDVNEGQQGINLSDTIMNT